ncbi:MAG: CoA-acylating methylmalonate-semialdehyde dehydrogenase [Planctomycetes bacterium]|nr:CoA-acylating methylmalonate-semialdehyde dehydrogenase [Planctomycetota bacterium]
MSKEHVVRNYIAGQWRTAEAQGFLDVENPATGEVIARTPRSTTTEVDRAVAAARQAFPAWAHMSVARRVSWLFRWREILMKNEEKISRILVEEMGKSLSDARAEMKRVYQNLETACAAPMLQQGSKLVDCAGDIDGEEMHEPIGVFAAITPFNFPAMAPFWFIPYALATGNTLVVKPSERVPLTLEAITEFLHELELPPGVYNVLNGDKDASIALVNHPDVKGVSFVGKTDTCRIIASRCAELGKRCQAMGSAKNHLVVMPDYKQIDELIRNMSTSCYGCAGQRCMASSVIVAIGDAMYERISATFVADSRKYRVDNPLNPDVLEESLVIGPVISAQSQAFIHSMIEIGVREGATLALDGRGIRVPGCEKGHFIGPTVFTNVRPGMRIHQTELFGPVVCIMKAGSLDEAINIINNHPYSNACSIYTQNGYEARKFKLNVETGMVGINVGIPAPVPFLPFGGMKSSMLCDIKMQSRSAFQFYTHNKVIVERYWPTE